MIVNKQHLEPGQFIPLVYHYNMLADQTHMHAFKEAIAIAVPEGSRVLELGGWYWCVILFCSTEGD